MRKALLVVAGVAALVLGGAGTVWIGGNSAQPADAAVPVVQPAAAAKAACSPFPDVNSSNVHCRNIVWLVGTGVTKPSDGLYRPVEPVTRGAMTAFLFRLTHPGAASPKCHGKPFPDVKTDYVFCGYIQWASKNHIAFGYSNGKFGPNNAVTRGAMAAFLKRIGTHDRTPTCHKKPYGDVRTGDTFCGVITWMKTNYITYGVGDGTDYGTTQSVTRQSMASFLRRIVELPGTVGDEYVLTSGGQRTATVRVTSVKKGTSVLVRVATTGIPFNAKALTIRDSHGTVYRAAAVDGHSVSFNAPSHGTISYALPGYDTITWSY